MLKPYIFSQQYFSIEPMTYIISGKLNNKPFLMIDSVSSSTDKKGVKTHNFSLKLERLRSAEDTYFCLTGSQILSMCIENYDAILYKEHKTFDYTNKLFWDEIRAMYTTCCNGLDPHYKVKEADGARVYFIDKDNVTYYNLAITPFNTQKSIIANNKVILPNGAYNPQVPLSINPDKTLYDFCKKQIELANSERLPGDKVKDFDNRFAFLTFDENGKSIYTSPLRKSSEVAYHIMDRQYIDIIEGKLSDITDHP